MNYGSMQGALDQYRKVSVESGIMDANPHRIIQMLFEGALDKISAAKGHIGRGEIEQKGKQVSWAVSILEGLRASLDAERGGELAQNLDALYEYMVRRLWEANRSNDATILDEVTSLLGEIKGAWDAIPEELRGGQAPAASNHG